MKAFLARPIEGDWPYLWIDATYVKVRQHDEWAVQRARYMTLETMAALSDDPTVSLPAIAS